MNEKFVADTTVKLSTETMEFISKIIAAILRLLESQAKTESEKKSIDLFKQHKGKLLTVPASDQFMDLAQKEGLLCMQIDCEGKKLAVYRDCDHDLAMKCFNHCKMNDMDLELPPADFIDAANDKSLIMIQGFETVEDIENFRQKAMEVDLDQRFSYAAVHWEDGYAVVAYKDDQEVISSLVPGYHIVDINDQLYQDISMSSIDQILEAADKTNQKKKETKKEKVQEYA